MIKGRLMDHILYETFYIDIEHNEILHEEVEGFVHNIDIYETDSTIKLTIQAMVCLGDMTELEFEHVSELNKTKEELDHFFTVALEELEWNLL